MHGDRDERTEVELLRMRVGDLLAHVVADWRDGHDAPRRPTAITACDNNDFTTSNITLAGAA